MVLALAPSLRTIHAVTTDGELIQRAADGDRSAFEDLYRRYARPVFGLALRRLGDRGRAEDAVQETFTSIWRSAARTGRSAARARRGSTPSRGTRSSTAHAPHRDPAEIPDEPAREAGPSERAEQSWVQWRVHRAMEELPEREREVLDARVLEWAVAERGRGVPRHSARHREDAHARGARAACGHSRR